MTLKVAPIPISVSSFILFKANLKRSPTHVHSPPIIPTSAASGPRLAPKIKTIIAVKVA